MIWFVLVTMKLLMTDMLYDNHTYTYKINDDDKKIIIAQLVNEFQVGNEIHHQGLWDCIPPLSNIRYLARRAQNIAFDGSETDRLCRSIHDKYALYDK